MIDDHWFEYVGDVGNAGPDKGKGGKYLLLPPGYDGEIPEGYFVLRTSTYGTCSSGAASSKMAALRLLSKTPGSSPRSILFRKQTTRRR